jgi:hypothetical protein
MMQIAQAIQQGARQFFRRERNRRRGDTHQKGKGQGFHSKIFIFTYSL